MENFTRDKKNEWKKKIGCFALKKSFVHNMHNKNIFDVLLLRKHGAHYSWKNILDVLLFKKHGAHYARKSYILNVLPIKKPIMHEKLCMLDVLPLKNHSAHYGWKNILNVLPLKKQGGNCAWKNTDFVFNVLLLKKNSARFA